MIGSSSDSENIGKLIVDVQNQITSMKKQLATISNDKFTQPSTIAKIQEDLNKIEIRNKKRAELIMLSSINQEDLHSIKALKLPQIKEFKSLSLSSHFKASTSLPSPSNNSSRKHHTFVFNSDESEKRTRRYLYRQNSTRLPQIESIRNSGKYPLNGKLISSKCILLT